MSLLIIAYTFVFAFLLDSGYKALRLDPKAEINRVVFVLDLDLALWALYWILTPFLKTRAWILASDSVYAAVSGLFFGFALHFCLLVAKPGRKLGRLSRFFIYAPGLAFTLFYNTVRLVPALHGYRGDPILGPYELARLLFIVYYSSFLLIGLVSILHAYFGSHEPFHRGSLRILVVAMALPMAGGLTTDFVLPALVGASLPDVIVFWASFWVLGVRIAISRYGFIAAIRNIGDAGRLFSAFLRNSRDGIVLSDEAGNIAAWNDAMEAITGYRAAEVLDRPIWEVQASFRDGAGNLTPEEIKATIRAAAAGAMGDWVNRTEEYPIRRKGGERRWLQSSAFLIKLSGGRMAFAAILRDITEEKQAEEAAIQERRRLEMAEKMEAIGTLAAGLAHDFNNILTGIKGTIALLRLGDGAGEPVSPDELKSGLDLMDSSATRGSELVRQLLALAGKSAAKKRPIRLDEALSHAILLTRNSVDPSVLIEANDLPAGAKVLAEDGQVERILINLIRNAADSMTAMRASGEPWGGRVAVSARREPKLAGRPDLKDGYWVLSVKDEGVGIGEENLSRVFDPFYTTKTDGGSHGLGLPTVYAIAERYGGLAEVKSEPGKGSEFRIWLPAIEASEPL